MLEVSIYKDFGNFILDLDFVSSDGVLGILGASGSGKSLSLKCLAGLVKPDRGRIVLNDRVLFDSQKNINLRPQERKVGFLFQDYALFPHMTVYENIKTAIRDKKADRDKLVRQKLVELNLEKVKDKLPEQISGGEKQRVGLARILVNDAELLLMDEPYSAIDGYLRWIIEFDIKNTIEKYKIPTIFVSHDRDEVYRMCDSIVVMDEGKSEKIKKTKDLFANPETLAAAELSGCKNFSNLSYLGNNTYHADSWGLDLSLDFYKECDYLGIRSHHIKISEKNLGKNSYKFELIKEIEELFGYSLIVKVAGGKDSSKLRIDIEKDKWEKLRKKEDLFFQINQEKLLYLKK